MTRESRPGGALRRLALAAGVIAFAGLTVGGALFARGREAMARSDEALARGDHRAAVVLAERAAQARFPGSPYPERGYERLFSIADDRAKQADDEGEKAALRAVLVAAQTSGGETARAEEARRRLDAVRARPRPGAPPDPQSPAEPSTSISPAVQPPRYGLAASATLLLAALAWLLARGGKGGWIALAAGIVGTVLSALQ